MSMDQMINLPVYIQILAVSGFFITKKATLSLWFFFLSVAYNHGYGVNWVLAARWGFSPKSAVAPISFAPWAVPERGV